MFSPNNLRTTAQKARQSAKQDNDGKIILEAEDHYGDLQNPHDVLLAVNTMTAIWQKLHPTWPVGIICSSVCINMKMFHHCQDRAKEVMVDFVNRLLAANSSR